MTAVEMQPITDWQQPLPDAHFYTAYNVDEALTLVREHEGARFIAGGTSLVRMGRWGGDIPPVLVYIGRIDELKQIHMQDGRIVIGSLAVHNLLRKSPDIQAKAGLLLLAAQEIAGPAVRNLATLGGNVCINWDMVPSLMALDAHVHIRSHAGEQVIPLAEFYTADGQPRLQPDQLITAISVATDLPRFGYQKVARRQAVSRAIVSVGVSMAREGDTVREVRIGAGGAGLPSRRLRAAEDLLRGKTLSEELVAQAATAAFEATADARPDYEANSWYTREMTRVMTERAINSAAGRPVL